MSLSGKQGLFLYADRSLYEDVHFNQEPTSPTIISLSLSHVDREIIDNVTDDLDSIKDNSSEDSDNDFEKRNKLEVLEVDTDLDSSFENSENDRQRSQGALTLSSIPRA